MRTSHAVICNVTCQAWFLPESPLPRYEKLRSVSVKTLRLDLLGQGAACFLNVQITLYYLTPYSRCYTRKRTHNQPPTVSLSISDKKCYPLYLNIQRGFLTPTPHFPTQMPQPPPIFHQRSLHFGKHCMIIRRSGGIDGLHSLERIWWDYKVVMVVYRGG